MPNASAPIHYLPYSREYNDYRPVFSPDGRQVLYERTKRGDLTHLWIYTLPGGENPIEDVPRLFIQDPPEGFGQTRADWCRAGDQEVAFAGMQGTEPSIWFVSGDGTNCRQVDGTAKMTYPAWYPGGDDLAVMAVGQRPGPRTKKIDRSGTVVAQLTDPQVVYAGMPTVNQVDPEAIAFAGQRNQGQYDQFNNQIWLANPEVSPSPWQLDPEQGRAPWWSPDGQWLAFESNRSNGSDYAIYIAKADGSELHEIPGTSPGGQHAKWSPDGKSLVCVLKPDPDWPNRIGIVDVSEYVGA